MTCCNLAENNVLYFNDGGTYASPTWAVVSGVQDVSSNQQNNTVETTTRDSNGFVTRCYGLTDASLDITVQDCDSAGVNALQSAFFGKTNIDIAALDGPIATSGSEGLRAEMIVASFTRNEAVGQANTITLNLQPATTTNPPSWQESNGTTLSNKY